MAARLRRRHDDSTRLAIKTSQIINRLMDHVLNGVEMAHTQVRAAEILLKKVLPDKTEQRGTVDHNHRHSNEPVSESSAWIGGMLGDGQKEPTEKPVTH